MEKSRCSITLAPFAHEHLRQHRLRHLEEKLKAGPAWTDHNLVFSSMVGGHLHTSWQSQISMTMDIYSHVLPTMQQDAMRKLNDALQG